MKAALSVSIYTRLAAAAVIAGAVAGPPSLLWQVDEEGWGTPAADETTVYFTTRRHEVVAVDLHSGQERWRTDTNEPGGETLGFGAVVAGSVVAVGDYAVVAFDRRTGRSKWRFDPTEGHAPGPYIGAVTKDMLLTGSAGNRVHAVDQETGALEWSTSVTEEHNTLVFPPIAADGLAIAGYSELSAPANRGGVVAIDLATGSVRWRQPFPGPADPSVGTNSAGGPILFAHLVLATSADGSIYALNRQTGAIEWSLPRLAGLPAGNVIDPARDYRALAISGSTLLAGSLTGVVVGFDIDTRRERWRFHDPWLGSAVMRVAADERAFYLPFFSGEVVALDAATGKEQWRVGDWKAGFIWAPLVWKNRLFLCATHEGLFAFNRLDLSH